MTADVATIRSGAPGKPTTEMRTYSRTYSRDAGRVILPVVMHSWQRHEANQGIPNGMIWRCCGPSDVRSKFADCLSIVAVGQVAQHACTNAGRDSSNASICHRKLNDSGMRTTK